MSVRTDAAGLTPQTLVELFEFDPTNIGQPSGSILRWHPGTTVERQPIFWQGIEYTPYPVEITGMDQSAVGKLPRPVLRASNIGGQLAAFLRGMEDGLGARLVRRRTYGRYLDAVNFPSGNPSADPTQHFDDDLFFVARRSVENPVFVEYELAVAFDVAGIKLPRRQVVAGTCQWVYRSAACSYAGPAVLNDPIFPGQDKCGKTLASCKRRFGEYGVLRTSAFPASLLARYA